jgi:1,4-alpha-glucan branching enzyme
MLAALRSHSQIIVGERSLISRMKNSRKDMPATADIIPNNMMVTLNSFPPYNMLNTPKRMNKIENKRL